MYNVRENSFEALSNEANHLLDQEMKEIAGGFTSGSCSASDDLSINLDELSPVADCSSCNKTSSCQTHT
jgi:hypothetical protein